MQSELNPLPRATENEEHNNLVELVPAPLVQRRIAVPAAGRGRAGTGARGRGRVVQRHGQRGGDADVVDVVVQVHRRGDKVAAAKAGADLLPGRPAGPDAAVPAPGGRPGRARHGVGAHHAAVGLRDALPELRVHVPAHRTAAAREPRQRGRLLPGDAAGARVAGGDLDQRPPVVVVVVVVRLRL